MAFESGCLGFVGVFSFADEQIGDKETDRDDKDGSDDGREDRRVERLVRNDGQEQEIRGFFPHCGMRRVD